MIAGVPTSELSPVQAGLRFSLEVAALVAWGAACWEASSNAALQWTAAIAVPVALAAVWAVFRVPGDASASGAAPVPVWGTFRLALELAVLLGAGVAIAATGATVAGGVLVALVVLHYATTPNRVRWLLQH